MLNRNPLDAACLFRKALACRSMFLKLAACPESVKLILYLSEKVVRTMAVTFFSFVAVS